MWRKAKMLRIEGDPRTVHAARGARSRPSGQPEDLALRREVSGRRRWTHRGGGLRSSDASVLPGPREVTKHARYAGRCGARGQSSRDSRLARRGWLETACTVSHRDAWESRSGVSRDDGLSSLENRIVGC